ncbi:uncharacterized protein JCM15063_006288 [Sporobolomyces koalae]|uniref:uncharacterized protein n=1 Tax=Sporobolomyces koalae TaxID=500713 RepID=UPI00317540F8
MTGSSRYTIPTTTPRVEIIYDFVSRAEEAFLLDHIARVGGDSVTTDEPSAIKNKNWGWKSLNGRRSMYWGGTILAKNNTLIPSPFPPFMDGEWPDILDRIAETGVYDEWTLGQGSGKQRGPNHCLVNEYLPGQGILPHTDGPAYKPCTTTLSLSSHTILSLRPRPTHLDDTLNDDSANELGSNEIQKIDILLPPRSLLILSNELYADWVHGIQPFEVSTSESLKRCNNWEQWWQYLVQMQRDHGDDNVLIEQGLVRGDKDKGETGDGRKPEQEKALHELKSTLRDLNLLSDDQGSNAARTKLERTETTDKVDLLLEAKREIEQGGIWKRTKRISLTCRRVDGKVRDLAGLLGTSKLGR